MRRLRIGIIAAARFPVVEPFAGGLEAHVWGLADRLRTLGHEVRSSPVLGAIPAWASSSWICGGRA